MSHKHGQSYSSGIKEVHVAPFLRPGTVDKKSCEVLSMVQQACAPYRIAARRTRIDATCGAASLKQCVESWHPGELVSRDRELLESRDVRAT